MMKKLTAHTFLLLATIILMAHAVMPHHHHQSLFCIENRHCHHQDIPDPFDNDHNHDGESSTNCILKQLIITTANHDKQECKCTDHSHGPLLLQHWYAVELHNEFQPLAVSQATEVEYKKVTSAYSLLLITTSGLRGPPAV